MRLAIYGAPAYATRVSSTAPMFVPSTDHTAVPDDWRPPKAVGMNVIVAPVRCATERATILGEERVVAIDEATGLTLGREVERHVARVVSIGHRAARACPELTLGAYVCWQRDRHNEFDHDGIRLCVVSLQTECHRCGAELVKDEVLGVWG